MAPIFVLFIFTFVFFSIGPLGSFPLNDDWFYTLAALKTFENSHFTVVVHESAWVVPQTILNAVWIKVFGFSFFNLRILTFLIAFAGLWGFDRLLLLQNANKYMRILAALCLIGFFPFLPLSASSMSDIYFFTLWIYACLTIELAFRTDKNRTWFFASIFILLCSLERQFGIVIVLAGLIYGFQSKKTLLKKFVSVSLVPLVGVGIMALIWSYILNVTPAPLLQSPSVQQRLGNLFCLFLYFGIGAFPFALASLNWKIKKFPYGLAAVFFLFILGTWLIAPWNFRGNITGDTMPFFGNLLSRHGFFMRDEVLHGFREVLFGGWFWNLYTLLGIIGAVFLLHQFWRSKQDCLGNCSVTIIASVLYLAAVIITRNPLFDRYLLPAFSGLLLYLAASFPNPSLRSNRFIAMVGAFLLIFFSMLVTQDYFRWNEAKWAAANWSVAQGYSPLSIDGGYEWSGWHKNINPKQNENQPSPKIIISFSELEGTTTLKKLAYESWIRKGSIFCLLKK